METMIPTPCYEESTPQPQGPWLGLGGERIAYPLDLQPQDIQISDIAHALSNICRFGGRTSLFYSVAQHSVHVSQLVAMADVELGLAALMHDAAEAYLGDVVTPIKQYLSIHIPDNYEVGGEFRRVEQQVLKRIFARFEIPWPTPTQWALIHGADQTAFTTECRDLMGSPTWAMGIRADARKLDPVYPTAAGRMFLATWDHYRLGRQQEGV